MTEPETGRQKGIEELLAERKKFEAWLAQLDAKRASAASHVFDRVHADYTKRLDDVRTRLRDEAESLRTLVGDLETRLGKEQDKVTKKTDERAEAELRAMVGEFAEKEWNTTRGKLDSAIADLRAKFDATERELADLKGLLASMSGAPAPARASVIQQAVVTVAAALGDAQAGAPGLEKQPEPPAPEKKGQAAGNAALPEEVTEPSPPRKPTPFDELAFLRSVAGTPSRPSGTAAVPPPSAGPVVAPVAAPEPEMSAEPEPLLTAEPEVEAGVPDADAPRSRPSTGVGEPSALGGPTPRTSQAIRSLKCQECGTQNFPTEWYCERCGGELAAF